MKMNFKFRLRIGRVLVMVVVIVAAVGLITIGYLDYFGWRLSSITQKKFACTTEAKLCPDGSAVGRSGSNCEFAKCPPVNEQMSGFGNAQLEKAVVDYLLTQNYFSWKTSDAGRNFCVAINLSQTDDIFPLYIWARCGEYILESGQVKEISGTSVPVKINYPNELSYYDITKFTYKVPRDGSYNGTDIERIFPAEVRKQFGDLNPDALSLRLKKLAAVSFNLPVEPTASLSEAEARVIAEKTCVKGGEVLSAGTYNPNSKTWWYDANLNATHPGCHPACVVSEETKTAEVNWRCTGAIVPN